MELSACGGGGGGGGGSSSTNTTTSAPSTSAITFSSSKYDFNHPNQIAVDASGNVWVTNLDGNSVTEIPATTPNSPVVFQNSSYGFAGPFGIAIDQTGNIWITNSNPTGNGANSVTEIPVSTPDSPITYCNSGCSINSNYNFNTPRGIAVDPSGNIWVANYGYGINGTVTELVKNNSYKPSIISGFIYPDFLASDSAGNIWVSNYGYAYNTNNPNLATNGNMVTEIQTSSSNALITFCSASYCTYNLNPITAPSNIAVDSNGNIWTSNGDNSNPFSIVEIVKNALTTPNVYLATNYGFTATEGLESDGNGNMWFADYSGNNVIELPVGQNSFNSFSSLAVFDSPTDLAIDKSGNVWVTNFSNNTVVELVGVAASTPVPLTGISSPKQ